MRWNKYLFEEKISTRFWTWTLYALIIIYAVINMLWLMRN